MIIEGNTIPELCIHVLRLNKNKPMTNIQIYNILREHDPSINPDSVFRCLRDLVRKNPTIQKTSNKGEYIFKIEDKNAVRLDTFFKKQEIPENVHETRVFMVSTKTFDEMCKTCPSLLKYEDLELNSPNNLLRVYCNKLTCKKEEPKEKETST